MRARIIILFFLLTILTLGFLFFYQKTKNNNNKKPPTNNIENATSQNPLSIPFMQSQKYPGSNITIESTLSPGSNYKQYIASYLSQGLKIYALLTVPDTTPPSGGFPTIVFNHGFIAPNTYTTTGNYVTYVDSLARAGYVVFKPDYRGHGNSEGKAKGGYSNPDYTIDVLNALTSIQKYKNVNPEKIGMWGHSMGGQMTLRSVVISKDIKAAVIWSGVIAPYKDILENWHHNSSYDAAISHHVGSLRDSLVSKYGTPEANPVFWNEISPNNYLKDTNTPLELFASENDPEVPISFSQTLYEELKILGKTVEFTKYPNDNHNLSNNFNNAMEKTIEFFNSYLK